MNSLIILAAGYGSRAKQKDPKQFILLNKSSKKSRLLYNQYAYKNNDFDETIIVVPKEWHTFIKQEIPKKIKLIIGGKNRTESSYLGLQACSDECENVLIHDAARPFASKKLFNTCIENLIKFDSVIPIIDQKDTLILKKKHTVEYLNRDTIKSIQTPQGFKYNLIRTAYDNNKESKTDDLQILLQYKPNASIKFIVGSDKNFKITTEHEINLLKQSYANQETWDEFYE